MQCENIMNSLRRMIDELKRANTQVRSIWMLFLSFSLEFLIEKQNFVCVFVKDDAEKEQVLKDDTAKEQELKDDAAKEQELKDKIEAIKKEISELRNKVQAQPQSPIMTEKDDNGINSEDEDDVEKLREHQSPCSSNMTSTQNNDSNASDWSYNENLQQIIFFFEEIFHVKMWQSVSL